MAWVKIDDHFDEHPKLAAVGPLGWGYWLAGLAYCNRNLTDGFIPWSKARLLASFETLEPDAEAGAQAGAQAESNDDASKVWTLSRHSGMTGDDIDADWVISVLVKAGLWDVAPGGYRIHDYEDFQPTKAQILAEREAKRAAGRAGGKASAQARGQADAQAPAKPDAQAKSNPVPVPDPVPKKKSNSSKETPEFVRFYEAYPRHIARGDAWKAWQQLDPDDDLAERVIEAVKEQARVTYRETPKQYIPYPASWLRSGRWDDDIEQPTQPGSIAVQTDDDGIDPRIIGPERKRLLREKWIRDNPEEAAKFIRENPQRAREMGMVS